MDNTKIILLLASEMLSLANDEFGNHGCNDLDKRIYEMIPDDMLEDMRQLNSKGNDPWPEKASHVGDSGLMWYLSCKLKELAPIIDRDAKINNVLDK